MFKSEILELGCHTCHGHDTQKYENHGQVLPRRLCSASSSIYRSNGKMKTKKVEPESACLPKEQDNYGQNVFKKQPNWWLADFSIWADVPSSCGCLLETILSCLAFKQLTLFHCFSSKSTSGLIFRSALDFHKRYETKQDFEHNDEKEKRTKTCPWAEKTKTGCMLRAFFRCKFATKALF